MVVSCKISIFLFEISLNYYDFIENICPQPYVDVVRRFHCLWWANISFIQNNIQFVQEWVLGWDKNMLQKCTLLKETLLWSIDLKVRWIKTRMDYLFNSVQRFPHIVVHYFTHIWSYEHQLLALSSYYKFWWIHWYQDYLIIHIT